MDKGRGEYQSQGSQLRKVLNVIFPTEYIDLYHKPPNSICSLLNVKICTKQSDNWQQTDRSVTGAPTATEFTISTEPSSRANILNLRDNFNSSLVRHQAKAVGLCPIRRTIYDQCFDELIRQVTVGCIEQGLLLFRIRNELRMTLGYYRKAYESGVEFGLRKAVEAKLSFDMCERMPFQTQQIETTTAYRQQADENADCAHNNRSLHEANQLPLIDRVTSIELKNKLESFDRTIAYYKKQLAERDKVIERQRATIKALSREAYSDIRDSV